MTEYPSIALNAMSDLATRVEELRDRYRELATECVEQRLAQALIRLAAQTGTQTQAGVLIDVPLSRQDVAEMIGTTLYTVSRILGAWERIGLVDVGRQRVEILDRAGLKGVADAGPVHGAARVEASGRSERLRRASNEL